MARNKVTGEELGRCDDVTGAHDLAQMADSVVFVDRLARRIRHRGCPHVDDHRGARSGLRRHVMRPRDHRSWRIPPIPRRWLSAGGFLGVVNPDEYPFSRRFAYTSHARV